MQEADKHNNGLGYTKERLICNITHKNENIRWIQDIHRSGRSWTWRWKVWCLEFTWENQ